METKKAIHLYGLTTLNAGDHMLGNSTKWWFEKNLLKNKFNIEWTSKSCRPLCSSAWVDSINNDYDYLVVGGGGLFLPDTNPNLLSGWQWKISTDALSKIEIPIYVISVGYNLFYNQTIEMPNRGNSKVVPERTDIFKRSVETLIEKSEYFSVRHRGDIESLKEILDDRVHNKIKLQFCPTIEYSRYKAESMPTLKQGGTWAIEIKDDRPNRRYWNTSRSEFYESLCKFIKYMKVTYKIEVGVLFNDMSRSFYNFLKKQKYDINTVVNSKVSEETIIKNFKSVDVLFCMAGHSQMIGHALGCRVISLIAHDKLKYFLQDIGEYTDDKYVDVNHDNVYDKLKKIGDKLIKQR